MAKVIKLALNGREYRCTVDDLTTLTIGEARAIKRHTGMRIAGWTNAMAAIEEIDPDAFVGLVYLLQTRAGEPFDWAGLDDMPILDLLEGFSVVDEPAEDAESAVPVAAAS